MPNTGLFVTVLLLVCVILLIRALALAGIRRLVNARPMAKVSPYGRTAAISAALLLRRLHPGFFAFLRRRLQVGTFTGLPLTLLVLAALYIAALLAGLTHEVLEAEGTLGFDEAVNAALAPWRQKPLIDAFLWLTQLGSGPALGAAAMTATAFLWASRRANLIIPLWVAFLGAQLTTWAGKYAIDRHRPQFIEGVSAMSPSFPSGHSTGAMAVYGFLAYGIARELPGWRPRFEAAFWAGILIIFVGFSRMYLSAHYLTDVAAGFLVGGFWLAVAFAIAEWKRGRSRA
jgi:undecaprenyl-diphosphatase